MDYYYENELYHWGIKGMKWGVRRYQNSDGTLTNAGKKRYSQELRDQLQTGGSQGKQWYEMSKELASSSKFKSALGDRYKAVTEAHAEFVRASNAYDKSYRDQSRKLSEKKLNSLVDEEIKKNKDFYQSWKPRFFDKDGQPTEELIAYVKDGIQGEYASRNKQHEEIEDAYNRAWKNYDKLRTEAVDDLLGSHKHDSVQIYNKTYGRTNNVSVRQIVDDAISNLDNTQFEFYE